MSFSPLPLPLLPPTPSPPSSPSPSSSSASASASSIIFSSSSALPESRSREASAASIAIITSSQKKQHGTDTITTSALSGPPPRHTLHHHSVSADQTFLSSSSLTENPPAAPKFIKTAPPPPRYRHTSSASADQILISSLVAVNAAQQKIEAQVVEEAKATTADTTRTARTRTSLRSHFQNPALSDTGESIWSSGHISRSGSVRGSSRHSHEGRVIFIHNPEKTNDRYQFSDNKVRTSKYSLLSFVPINLFEQFRRIAYIYFLAILCLNQIPQLAVFGRFASALPLAFVLIVTAVKDGYEDWRRHRSDKKENDRIAMVCNEEGVYAPKLWKHIRVGEVVKVQANDTIPCDLVLLRTSDPSGLAYVQTINLDGESNLKTRYARLETAAEKPGAIHPTMFSGRVICEKPNRNIYGFTAFAEIDGKTIPLVPTNIILRGCELKNTSWAIGVAVYTGQETKVMLNSTGAQSKSSRLEGNMNRETLWLSLFLFICCLVSGLGMGFWLKRHEEQLDVLPYYGQTKANVYGYYGITGESIFAFLSSLISFQIMIPISLYISMELVRLGQSYFMINDVEMYHAETDTRLQCRDLGINEDLGQVKYIFSDKTGTLTENKMEFRRASIFGENYGDGVKAVKGFSTDPSLVQILQDDTKKGMERKAIHDFLLTLSVCNTVVPTKVSKTTSGALEMEVALGTDNSETAKLEYQGESPDEQALVSAAASYGYTLLSRTSNYIVINVLGEIQRFEVLGMHEFDSTRKCMSVVLKCPDGSVKVLVKGADSTMLKKIALAKNTTQIENEEQSRIVFNTQMHLAEYSEQGLRTLVVASRSLSTSELKHWERLYMKANSSLNDRSQLLREASEAIEKDLTLLGATGIEDKLQQGVPDAIATLREAGIKIWVLTGDKQETAISIGFSCALLTSEMKQIIINEPEKESCREAIRNAKATYIWPMEKRQSSTRGLSFDVAFSGPIELHSDSARWNTKASSGRLQEFSGHLSDGNSKSLRRESGKLSQRESGKLSQGSRTLALIIDGNSLVHALEPDFAPELYELATACQVVICCRVAPLQKAGIVSLVKHISGEMTLAIGDGANDVSMIQMADVGVGISGQEGRQAVLASDFALGQFRFLKRLLLVHGRLNYRRMGSMVLYNFYRNAILVMLLFWYMLYSAFSTSPPITQWSLVLYSIIYTSVPTIIVAILDRDLDSETLLRCPALYKGGQHDDSYNKLLFWLTVADTLWQSLVLFYVPYLTHNGSTIDIWSLGSIWTISVVVLVNIHLAMDVEHFTWITHLALWGSIAATYVCIVVLDMITDETQAHYWVIFHVARTSCYWLDIILIIILALLPRFTVKIFRQRFNPSDAQIVRENEILSNAYQDHISP